MCTRAILVHVKDSQRINGFCTAIWEWYGVHKRELPWRDMRISDVHERAYRVLVSEVMLQQTQVSRVKIVFKDFLEKFSSMKDLALANNAEVILAWRGMGYNSRALRLRDAARTIVQDFDGKFPHELDQLRSIKGIGPYTAGAIRNFAFNIPTPCIDTNIRRILHRTFIGPENTDGSWEVNDGKLMEVAAEVLKNALDRKPETRNPKLETIRGGAADWHAALMDYGSLIQMKTNPKWDICILTSRGLMKTTPENWVAPVRGAAKEKLKKEPGREVGGVYIPNRIFRGRIVESLRDARGGLSFEEIGRDICIDWDKKLHQDWLKNMIKKLVQEEMLRRKGKVFVLAD